MKVRELLELVDTVKTNSVDDALKTRWIADVEGRVLCELHKADPTQLDLVIGEDYELSVPDAYAKMYVAYLVSMLEFVSGNYEAYGRMRSEYEQAFSMYARYLIRNR